MHDLQVLDITLQVILVLVMLNGLFLMNIILDQHRWNRCLRAVPWVTVFFLICDDRSSLFLAIVIIRISVVGYDWLILSKWLSITWTLIYWVNASNAFLLLTIFYYYSVCLVVTSITTSFIENYLLNIAFVEWILIFDSLACSEILYLGHRVSNKFF